MNTYHVRASGLPGLFDCAARWEAQHILKLGQPRSSKAVLGTALHASTAHYDQAVLEGYNPSPADAVKMLVNQLYYPDYEVDWEDTSPEKLEPIARALHNNYCDNISPRFNWVAVEVTCHDLTIEFEDLGVALWLTGTTDRIYASDTGGYGIADIKSGAQAVTAKGDVNTKKHLYQLGVYEIIAEYASGTPINEKPVVIGLQTNSKARVGIGTAKHSPKDLLIGTPEDPGVLHHAARILAAGDFPGNPSSMMCHERYCPIYNTCKYRG